MNKALVAKELTAIARDLIGVDREAALNRKDFDSVAAAMKSSGVAKNKKFTDFMVKWLGSHNPIFDENMFRQALE